MLQRPIVSPPMRTRPNRLQRLPEQYYVAGARKARARLLETNCETVEQMRLVNALCRFVEMAEGG